MLIDEYLPRYDVVERHPQARLAASFTVRELTAQGFVLAETPPQELLLGAVGTF